MILDKKSSMEWTNCDHNINNEYHIAAKKNQFSFWPNSIVLIIWSLDAASVSIYVNVLKWRPAALWIFDSQPGCSRRATYWFAQDRAPGITSDPRYIFGNAAQDVSGGGRRYIRGNLLVGKTRKIWKGWFDWDGDLFTIYYLFSALWRRTSRNPWEMWHRPLSFASLKR